MFNALAAGRKVYGQGGYAPTRGQVSAQGAKGYIQREVTKNAGNRNIYGGVSKTGADGRSDTRSGIAARALNRQIGQQGQPQHNNPAAPKPPKTPNQPAAPVGPPPIKINKDGILELPYNQEVSQGILDSQQQMNEKLMELQAGQQQQGLAFGQNMRQTDLDYGNLQRATLNDNAGRGTIFSSSYGQALGNDANAYNNQKNDLIAQNSLFNIDTDRQRLGIESAFQNMLSQFGLDQANAAAPNAGSLGYGDTKGTPGPNTRPRKHHPKQHHKPKPKKGGGKK